MAGEPVIQYMVNNIAIHGTYALHDVFSGISTGAEASNDMDVLYGELTWARKVYK